MADPRRLLVKGESCALRANLGLTLGLGLGLGVKSLSTSDACLLLVKPTILFIYILSPCVPDPAELLKSSYSNQNALFATTSESHAYLLDISTKEEYIKHLITIQKVRDMILSSDLVASSDLLQMQEPQPVGFTDKGKFVSSSDVSDLGQKVVIEKITAIQTLLAKSSLELKTIQDAFQWRTALPSDFTSYREKLRRIEIEHELQADKLHGISGVNTLIASVTDKSSIPAMIKQIQHLEVELLLSQKTRRQLEAICESAKFRKEYAYIKQILPELYETLTNVDALTAFITKLDDIIKNPVTLLYPGLQHLPMNDEQVEPFTQSLASLKPDKNPDRSERLKIRARKELFLQVLELCKHISDEKIGDPRLEHRLKGLNPLIAHIKTDLNKRSATANIAAIHLSALPNSTNKEYSFWSKTPTGSKTWFSRWGSYEQSGSIGTVIESQVAEKLPYQLTQVTARLTEICQGNLDPTTGHQTLKEELDYYQSSLLALEKEYDTHFNFTYTAHYDKLVPVLLDYGYGLEHAFTQVRALLKLAYKCINEPTMAIFCAINKFESYCSDGTEVTELAQVFQSYHAMKQMKKAEEINFLKDSKKSFDIFMERTSKLLREVYAKKGPEMLKLTDTELLVPETLLSQNSISSLYNQEDNHEILPLQVMSYISKRAIQHLFLPGATHDIELELVLYVIRQNFAEQLQKSVETFDDFKEIITSYDKKYAARRLTLEYDIKPAAKIVQNALLSSKSSKNILNYARATQQHIEYLKSGNIVENMKNALNSWLQKAVSLCSYVPIYPEVADKEIKSWFCQTPLRFKPRLEDAAEKLRVAIPNVSDQERVRQVFESVFLRILCASLFASDPYEQLLAQQQITTLLNEPEYNGYIQNLSDGLKELLCESSLDKILVATFATQNDLNLILTAKETELLLVGPIAQFLLRDTLPETAKLPLALYKLISVENRQLEGLGQLATSFIESKGLLPYERWMAGLKALTEGNPLSSAVLDAQEN